MNINEQKILRQAVERLRKLTDRHLQIQAETVILGRNKEFDALLSMKAEDGENFPLVAFVKENADSVEQVIEFIRRVPRGMAPLLIAAHIAPEVVSYLDKRRISFFGLDGQFRYILPSQAPRRHFEMERVSTGEAMVRVIFVLLQDPTAFEWSQRTLALKAEVSLGTVSNTLKNLEAMKYLVDSKKVFRFNPDRVEDLIKNWSTIYVEKVKQKYLIGAYRSLDKIDEKWFSTADSQKPGVMLGGEWAAEKIFQNRVRGEGLTKNIYFRGAISDLIKRLRIVRDDRAESPIYVLEPFWLPEFDPENSCTPDLVTYSDLSHNYSDRHREIAATILKQRIIPRTHGRLNN